MLRLVQSALRRPRIWIAAIAAVTLALGAALPRIELRTDGAAIYPLGNATVRRTETDRGTFHDPEQVILLVGSKAGGEAVRSPAGLRFLRQVHDALRRLPGVQGSRVQSLASLLELPSGAGAVSLRAYLDSIPSGPAEFDTLLARLREDPLADGLLLSRDGRLAALYVPLAEGLERKQALHTLDRWMDARRGAPFELRLLGPVVAETLLGETVLRDLSRLTPLMVGVIGVLLFVSLRTPAGVLLPLLEALLVLVWTLGGMALCKVPITLVTTIMPVVLMAMAITDEIHLLERVQTRLSTADQQPGDARSLQRQVLLESFRDVEGPIVATTLTTAVGFFSFYSASMPPLRDFGVFTGLGILAAMLLSFTLVPALAVLLPVSWFSPRRGSARRAGEPAFEMAVGSRSGVGFLAGVLLLLACAPGLLRLTVQDSWVDNFDPRSPLATAERDFNAAFWGSYRFDVVVEREPGFFFRPEGAALVERLEAVARTAPHSGGVVTYLTPFARLSAKLGHHGPVSTLSEGMLGDLVTVAQMVEDQTGFQQLVTPDGGAARLRIFVNSPNYRRARELRADLEARLPPVLGRTGWHTSGDLPVALEVVAAIVNSQLRSIGWSLVGIAVLVFVSLRRLGPTLVACVPVTTSGVLLFGGMGYAGIPLGIATSMFASLSLGVGIDFALHIVHHYREERRRGLAHEPALRSSLGRTGHAIRWNALVLALGILVLTFSSLKPDRSLGVLLAAAVLSCYATTLLFLPWLLRHVRFGSAAVLVLVGLAAAPAVRAQEQPLPNPSDAAAALLVREVETDFRKNPRAVRMEFETSFSDTVHMQRSLWCVVQGDAQVTNSMYVFTRPQRMTGTTLLLRDLADPTQPDSSWLYLASFESFHAVDPRNSRFIIPGTALTYEDSRGYISADKFDFMFAGGAAPPASAAKVQLIGHPRTKAIEESLGYVSLSLRIDRRKHLVEHVEYTDAAGQIARTYDLLEPIQLRGVWLPKKVRATITNLKFISKIEYTYWPLRKPLEAGFYQPSLSPTAFLPRLLAALAREGIHPPVEPLQPLR